MVDIDQPDRPRGVLAEVDREYLLDPDNYGSSPQVRYKRRQDIQERIRHAFLDMSILADPGFDAELLEDAFRDPDGTIRMGEHVAAWRDRDPEVKERLAMDDAIMQAFIDTVALIANVANRNDYQGIIEEGTKTAVERFGDGYVVVDASYHPTVERPDDARKRAKWKLDRGHRLTDEEAVLLLKHGEIDPEAVAENLREHDDSDRSTDGNRTLADAIPSAQERGRKLLEEDEE